jgi:hypothetical protein
MGRVAVELLAAAGATGGDQQAMIVKEFKIGCSKVINLGNFQNIRIEAEVTIVVPEQYADLAELKKEAQHELREMMIQTWNEQRKA